MEEVALFARLAAGTLFLSAAVSKLRDMEKHRVIVEQYQVLPRGIVPLFAVLEVAAEGLVGVLLLGGLWLAAAYPLAGLLLAAYCIAIAVNLFRGRREISCGCGGAAGDHHLSWWLVARNAVLCGGLLWASVHTGEWGTLQAVLSGADVRLVFDAIFLLTVFVSYAVLFLLLGLQEWMLFGKRMAIMLEQE